MLDSDIIGETNIKLSALCNNGGMDDWFEIQHHGKSAGKVHLRGEWNPTGVALVVRPANEVYSAPPILYTNGQAAVHVTTKAPQPSFYVVST